MNNSKKLDPNVISRLAKERFLLSLSEDQFRDRVVRPFFLRRGYKDGRDLCGPDELGKDTIFISTDKLGIDEITAVQTKKGKLTMSSSASANIIQACTQLETAFGSKISFSKSKEKKYPDIVILCASGKINDKAKQYIIEKIHNPRTRFIDADDLIPLIDENIPEIWYEIDVNLMPYLRGLKQSVEELDPNSYTSDLIPRSQLSDSATDEMYVNLKLNRTVIKIKKINRRTYRVPHFEEFPIQGIIRKKYNSVLVTGEAGSGKSTAMRRIAYILAKEALSQKEGYLIPVLIKATGLLKDLERNKSLLEICYNEVRRVANSDQSCFTTDDVIKGRLIILIDGLDEVSDFNLIKDILSLLNDFHLIYPDCKIILTSRDYAYIVNSEELNKYVSYKISPISYKEVDLILKKFEKNKSLSKEDSKEILRRIEEIHGMELNPLLVTVFAATTEYSRQDIPANITELFKKFTEMMLGRWDASKGMAQQYQAPLKDFILRLIAFRMHQDKRTYLKLDEISDIIESELSERGYTANIDELKHEILYRSNLFRVVQDNVEFRHHLLQEFFAGRAIPNAEFLQSVVSDYWWQRSIVFYFGENPGSPDQLELLVTYIKQQIDGDKFAAAITLGLSLQASYLIKIPIRLKLIDWVIKQLSGEAHQYYFHSILQDAKSLTKFLGYYLYGREAVSCSILTENYSSLLSSNNASSLPIEEKDLYNFWIIIGLIENGQLSKANNLISSFRPKDTRLLLAIHLGCFFIQNLKISTIKQKNEASKILTHLESRIAPLRNQLLEEFTSELLEVRNGRIKAIEQ